MSNKLEELSEQALNKMTQYAQTAENFVVSEAPKYVKEFLEYEMWYHTQMLTIFIIIIILLMGFMILNVINEMKKKHGEIIISIMVFTFLSLIPFALGFHHYTKLSKIKMAPRVYILESLRR